MNIRLHEFQIRYPELLYLVKMPLKALAICLCHKAISLGIWTYAKKPNIHKLETSGLAP
jgi:hypothetical protein